MEPEIFIQCVLTHTANSPTIGTSVKTPYKELLMKSIQNLVLGALLIALGIVIPMVMPVRISIPPASYTLASHVPVFIAMFISPAIAAAVVVGTAFGFFLTSPPVIVARALSHIVFALIGAFYLKKHRHDVIHSFGTFMRFNLIIGIIHAIAECIVVIPFYYSGTLSAQNYESGFFISILLLVGVGGLVHSLIDFIIAQRVVKALPLDKKT